MSDNQFEAELLAPYDSLDVTPYERIEDLLDIRMKPKRKDGTEDPRIGPRRARLAEAFRALVVDDAVPLKEMLQSKRRLKHPQNQHLVDRFGRLASPTRAQMLKILADTTDADRAAIPRRRLRENFGRNVRQAATYLSRIVNYGRAEKLQPSVPEIRKYWAREPEAGVFRARLVLRSDVGVTPSQALKAIIADQQKWWMDCSQWVQAVAMNAMVDTLSPKVFDARMQPRGPFLFRVQESTGLDRKVGWQRKTWKKDGKVVPFERLAGTSQRPKEERSVDELLRISPAGTRVALSTDLVGNLPEISPWRFENTIKVGPGRYAAFGFGPPQPLSLNQLQRLYANTVAKKLAKAGKPRDAKRVLKGVYVQSIQQFDVP